MLRRWLVDGSSGSRKCVELAERELIELHRYRRTPDLFAGWLSDESVAMLRKTSDLQLHPDLHLSPFTTISEFTAFCKKNAHTSPGLNQVVEEIRAPQAWQFAEGDGVAIAIVDSGIKGTCSEFPQWKKLAGWSWDNSDPWIDAMGHGTMCAAIASASPEDANARLCGVAPKSTLLSCKTNNYLMSTILDAYEWIEDQKELFKCPVVVNNSFGFETEAEPLENGKPLKVNHPVASAVNRLVNVSGIPMVFAAGNNHDLARGKLCSPNTIWAWHSLDTVLTVAEVDENSQVRDYSSRGPGQWRAQSKVKPDCAAPTYGWILFGDKYDSAVKGWGTSGAAPQATGLIALLSERWPKEAPASLYDRVRKGCQRLNYPATCVGSGKIDCLNSVQ